MKSVCASLLLTSGAVAKSWSIAKNDVDTIILGIDFPTPDVGFIAGVSNEIGPFVKTSKDAGETWKPTYLNHTNDLMLMDVAMSSATTGVTSGMGFGLNGNAYTTDGMSFHQSEGKTLVTICQSVEQMKGVDNAFGLTGQWGGNQVSVSKDGGKTFEFHQVAPGVPARYGSFPSEDVWYITAGSWPASLDENFKGHYLSKFRRVHMKDGKVSHHEVLPRDPKSNDDGWLASIYKTTDGGKTFTEVFHDEGRFYPNQISCWDENTCQAVVEGDGSWDAAALLFTQDGGATWNMSLQAEGESWTATTMLSATEGWVAGVLPHSQVNIEGRFYHTMDAWQTQEMMSLNGADPMDLTFDSNGDGWGVAITPAQISTLVRYN